MKKFSWSLLALVLVVALSFLLITGCGPTEPVEEPTDDNGEDVTVDEDYTIVVGLSQTIFTLDPANHRDRVT